MQILKVIALLLNYPTAELQTGRDELKGAINEAREIPPRSRSAMCGLVDEIADDELMDIQSVYTSLFDRGRSLSMLLFEHVHGESRDRGQAMVDLMAQYEDAGFEINTRELPDYIPLYLEYLSTQDDIEARIGLADVSQILGLLSARLQERDSSYHCLFDALLIISGAQVEMSELLETAKAEERDDTPEALDKLWEEEAVSFSEPVVGGEACGNGTTIQPPSNIVAPVQWVEASNASDNPQVGG